MNFSRSIAAAVAFATLTAGSAYAAEDFEIGVSGFLHNAVSVQDVYNNSRGAKEDTFSVLSDNLISFNGSTVLDNGLKATAVAGFSFAQGTTDSYTAENQNNIYKEEIYVGLGGSFGEVNIGRRRNAAALLHTFIPSAGVGTFGVDDARTSSFVSGNFGMTTAASLGVGTGRSEYANRVQYFTPRIEGLQLAASFTPDTNSDDANANVGTPRYNSTGYKNEYSLAGNYARDLNGVGVKTSVGYTYGESNAGIVRNGRDFEAIQSGLNLSAHGFTVGAGYGQLEHGSIGVTSGKDRRYGAGAKYQTGPWGFGLSYLQRKASGNTFIQLANGEAARRSHLWEAGATYALGPGVTTGAGVYFNDNVRNNVRGAGKLDDSLTGLVNLSVNF